MNIKFSKAFLMSGKNFRLTDSITLRHPTLKDVLSINDSPSPDSLYWLYVQMLLADPYSHMVMLDDIGKNYLEVSPYEVFTLQWENSEKMYMDYINSALQFFIVEKHSFQKGIYEDGTVCFFDEADNKCQINKEIYEYLYEWVKSINKIEYSNRINPADENARRILIEDMRDELKKSGKRKKKPDDNIDYLGNIMSAVSFCGNGSITPFNMNDCKLYWINESLAISNKKNYADHILDGIYHGTIRSRDINRKELDWMQ